MHMLVLRNSLRPVLNLKTKEGLHQFRNIATEVAILVKKYRGSLRSTATELYEASFTFYDWATEL
jgi:hypothetical protein